MDMRKTKIVATIGPACDSEEMIRRMIEAGVDVFRFNMKHNTLEWHSERMEWVEKLAGEMGKRVAMLLDLQGPEVRIDYVPEKWAILREGDEVMFCKPGGEYIVLDHPEILPEISVGQVMYADDGFLEFEVVGVEGDGIKARVVEGGSLKVRKTVNFPGMHLTFPALIEKDMEHLSLTARHHVDFVALSFVRTVEDVRALRAELTKHEVDCKVIAKIEHPDAVEHFEEILSEVYGVMVARGDLGIEYPMEEVPSLQKMMVRRCREEGKPVIVATQMLESMIENPRPTRAEVSDVANGVYDGADALMLSAESAAGKYPIRAVKTMAKIAEKAESAAEFLPIEINWREGGQTAAVVGAAHHLMEYGFRGVCDLKAFVVLTETGRTVEYLSRMRPTLPIVALSKSLQTLDVLKLSWGVEPLYFDYMKSEGEVDIKAALRVVKDQGLLRAGEKVVMIYGEIWGEPGLTSVVRVQEVV
jgi:pyruvate kinase